VSNRDGLLGTGSSLNRTSLTIGNHTITLIGTDSQGAAAAERIVLMIVGSGGVQAPSAQIVSPAEGAVFAAGSGIFFSAQVQGISPQDAQAGRVWWSSSLSGRFAVGLAAVEHGLPLGAQTVYLTAVGPDGAAGQDSVRIEVVSSTANTAPLATILSPVNLSTFPTGAEIAFLGRGVDLEEGVLGQQAFTWASSLAGTFATGDFVRFSQLPDGVQWIYLFAADGTGAAGSDSVQILIGASAPNTTPVAVIIHPADGADFAVGTPVLFRGSGIDAEEGNLPSASLAWYSSRDGLIGRGDYLLSAELSEGVHLIRLLATDSKVLSGSAEVSISVVQGGNGVPAVKIDSPADRAAFPVDALVSFSGTASDPEDGVLAGNALVWLSDLDGELGRGTPLSVSQLTPGRHRIVLQATDSRGAAGIDTISIVLSNPPIVEITAPAVGSTFPIGTPVAFSGSARDPEEGILPAGSLSWYSSLSGGKIGSGASFVSNSLGVGRHRITLVATDRTGVSDSAWITLEIVSVPDTLVASISVGRAPRYLKLDPQAGLLYVSNWGQGTGDGSVSIVDLASFSESDRVFNVGTNPAGLDFSASLDRLYVALSGEDNLGVLHGGAVEQRIRVGFQPLGVAVGPNGEFVYVTNSNSASVSIVSTSTGTLTGSIPDVGNAPGNILIPPGGDLLFVSNYGSDEPGPDQVAAVNRTTGAITTITVGDKPRGLASTSDGATIFVANSGSASVSVISTLLLREQLKISVGTQPVACAVSPGNNQVYVANRGSGDITVIDVLSKTVIETISGVAAEPWDVAFHTAADGTVYVLIADSASDRIQVLQVR
ncbi:MAG TPA: YncE family protein, partial [Candidatus Glassbacteria bacterium]|nr:YncE family protein [Candidatus Glassbacteria bacterium]